jgi:uncharacterized membrane protein
MMMWYGVDGWGWCALIVNVLAVVVFLGVIIAVIVLAVRSAERSNVSATLDSGSARPPKVSAEHGARVATDDDDFLSPIDVAGRTTLIANGFDHT